MQPSIPLATAIVPAAGVGSRMGASIPKQYLTIQDKTILEHTIERLLDSPYVKDVVVAVSQADPYFAKLAISDHPQVTRVDGGRERADSVLSALSYLMQQSTTDAELWVMVHDAARPNIALQDIAQLHQSAIQHPVGAILAAPVRDTMKRSDADKQIRHTVERQQLWHALTPQMFRADDLYQNLTYALDQGALITDEASAFELRGQQPLLVQGRSDNLKITQPEDLALAEYYLTQQASRET